MIPNYPNTRARLLVHILVQDSNYNVAKCTFCSLLNKIEYKRFYANKILLRWMLSESTGTCTFSLPHELRETWNRTYSRTATHEYCVGHAKAEPQADPVPTPTQMNLAVRLRVARRHQYTQTRLIFADVLPQSIPWWTICQCFATG